MEKNFKQLKDRVCTSIFESLITNVKGGDFKKFVKEVRKSPILKEQLDIYYLVENEKFETLEDAKFILGRAMRVFEKYSPKEITEANKSIVESFGGTFDASTDDVLGLINAYFTTDKPNWSDYKEQSNVLRKITEGMVKVGIVDEDKPSVPITKKQIKRATAILNEKFSFLDDTEKEIFRSFITNDNIGKEKSYNRLLENNIKLVKRKLFESDDTELDEKLNLLESRLKEDKFTPDKEITDFVKLMELTTTLS